ncbi:hypothetical protein LSH36_184g03031, partial [Paralvinella palmiformis]
KYIIRLVTILSRLFLQPHEFDDCRFDVSVNDCLWYLRARNAEEKQKWMDMIDLHKQADSGYASENGLRRHGSMLSITSATSLSTASASSFKKGRGLREKLAEMETFRDILCRQVDTLQSYFDACASVVSQRTVHDLNILQQHGAHAIDFKGEAFTFKATTAGILATLSHCIELMMQREDAWKKRLEKEVEKNKKLKEAYKLVLADKRKTVIIGGPDFEEGPHSIMHEEEFFDAVDATLDKLDREEEKKKVFSVAKPEKVVGPPPVTSLQPSHPQYTTINQVVAEHMMHADMTAADFASTWMLIAEDGEMKVYKREVEENGMVVDPLKAVHTVQGVTGHELCHYFWDPSIRMEWESTLDSSTIVEWLSKDTLVTYQTTPRCVRIRFNVAMICQTIVQPPQTGSDITRDRVKCKIQYSANVNPGGWAPASVIRVISKRELPKFLKTFTNFVQQKTSDLPIMF